MPRRPLPMGTWGNIHVGEISQCTYEAHARFRGANGRTRQVRARGASENKAKDALKEKLGELRDAVIGGSLSPDARMSKLAEVWMADRRVTYKARKQPTGTLRTYDTYVRNWVLPALGEVRARELEQSPWMADQLIKTGLAQSYSVADSIRTVLVGICGYAVSNGAMKVNPVKALGRLGRDDAPAVRALDLAQRLDLLGRLEQLAEDKRTDKRGRRTARRTWWVWAQLPSIMRGMLSTGVRGSELLAISGGEVEPTVPEVAIDWHLVREPETGLHRYPLRKGRGHALLLGVPVWSVPTWRALKLASGGGPLWPTYRGGWQDPNLIARRLREGLVETGYDWVTPHVWRKTVATVLDEADLPTTAIADQLGNTPDVVERHYRKKRSSNTAAVAALEGMME